MKQIRLSIIGIITMLSVHLAAFSQQLKLGKNPYIIEKAAVLEMQSDNQGMLLPRIADTALINLLSPSDGMMIYHTASKKLLIRSTGRWLPLAVSADLTSDWSVAGNLNGSIKKLGNIDAYDLPFITNNVERLRVLSSGLVGINTTAPLQQLDVNGNMNLRGALMPNNSAGTSGYLLSSNGAGSAPSWRQLGLTDLSDIKLTAPSAGQFMMFNGTKWTDTTVNFLSSIDTSNIPNFFVKVRSLFSSTAPLAITNGVLSISQSSATTNGYLSSTDWNTFNNKAASFTKGNLTETNSNILTITGGTAAVIGSGTTIQVKQANASQAGFLSAADWTTFNNKLSTIDTTNIGNFYLKVRSVFNTGAGISFNTASGTVANTGVLSVNGNTGSLTLDTGYISNFYTKVRSELRAGSGIAYDAASGTISSTGLTTIDTSNISNFYVKVRSLFSTTAPLSITNGIISMTLANGTTNGYLSSADWTTFNNKAAAFTKGNLTEATSNVLTITGGTASIIGSGTTIQVKQANASQAGFLSNADWTTFNNKLSTIDTSNISGFYTKVRTVLNAGSGISFNQASGTIANTGVLSINGNTGALTLDTGYIANFYTKVRSELKAGSGIIYDAATGLISASAAASATDWKLNGNTNGTALSLGTLDNYSLPFITNGTERMRLTNTGRLGINVTAPAAMIDISAPTGSNPLNITGLTVGSSSDSLLTIMNGVVKKIAYPTFTSTSSNAWGLIGNAGTSASTNFLGTTDASPLTIRVNNQLSGRIDMNNTFLGYQAGYNNSGSNNSGIGYHALQANTSGAYNSALGYNALPNNATGSYNVGIGYNADISGNNSSSIAIGQETYITSAKSIAIGSAAKVQVGGGTDGIALGSSTYISGSYSIAIGSSAQTQAISGIAIGQNTYVSGANAIAIGSGSTTTQASGASSMSIGASAESSAPNSMAIGQNATSQGANGIVIGKDAYGSGQYSIAIGSGVVGTKSQATASIAMGSASQALGQNGLAIGTSSSASGSAGIAIGNSATSLGSGAVVLGSLAQGGSSTDVIAIGTSANTTSAGSNSIAIGKGATVSGGVINAVALGANATASQANTIILGDASNASTVVGIGTSTPNSSVKLDVSGSFELGSAGTLSKNMVNFEATVPAATLSNATPYKDFDVTIPSSSNYLTSARATVSVSFNADLPASVLLASARMLSSSVVRIRILSTSSSSVNVSSMKAYVSIIEF